MQTAARLRLHSLINRVQGDGEQEMLEDILLSEPPESKMLLALLSGSVICGGALFVCWLSGSSPTGGAHLSLESCQAAGLGLLASLPLAALKAATWTDGARRSFPALQDMQEREADVLKPLLERMSATQVAVVMMAEALPTLLMLLPAAQGALTLSLCTYADYLRDAGVNVPYNLPAALALITTASLAALARYLEHGISGEEYEAVDAAVRSADRYYRLTATNVSGRQDDAERMARAFKAEAASWVHRQQMAGNVAGLMAAFEVTFLGMLWRATGDLSAPAAACLMLHGVGFASLHRFAFQKRKRE
ncbi:g4392 [Coccomyxa elongata]